MYAVSKPNVSVMVWGCISCHGPGTLSKVQGNYISAEKFINILDNHLLSVNSRHFPMNDYIFQDDNASVHRARAVEEYKRVNNIRGIVSQALVSYMRSITIHNNTWSPSFHSRMRVRLWAARSFRFGDRNLLHAISLARAL